MSITFEQLGRPAVPGSVTVSGLGVVDVVARDLQNATEFDGNVGWNVIDCGRGPEGFTHYRLGKMYPTFGVEVHHYNMITWDELERPDAPCVLPVRGLGWVHVTDRDIEQARGADGRIGWEFRRAGGMAHPQETFMLVRAIPQ